MKSVTAITIFSLGLVAAIPLPLSCDRAVACLLTNPRLAQVHFADPHFPKHQLASSSSDETAEDAFSDILDDDTPNMPYTPSSITPPSKALADERPLTSAYLMSLSKSTWKDTEDATDSDDAAPAKPTSALPDLRKEDDMKYWEAFSGNEMVDMGNSPGNGQDSSSVLNKCAEALELLTDRATFGQSTFVIREHDDRMVVGIVFVFLAAVVLLEMFHSVGDLARYFSNSEGTIQLNESQFKRPTITVRNEPPAYGKVASSNPKRDPDSEFGDKHYYNESPKRC